MAKAGKKSADPALKYYFEMLGLPLSASEEELRTAYEYYKTERAPGQYSAGSAEQKKAEEKQAEFKFAYEKLIKWFAENPDTNIADGTSFRFDGDADQWKKHQDDRWTEELKEFRAQETLAWKAVLEQRKATRVNGFFKRTKILATVICALAITGLSWHQGWLSHFRQVQAQNLLEETKGRFLYTQDDRKVIHDTEIDKAYKLKAEWDQDDSNQIKSIIATVIASLLTAFWWWAGLAVDDKDKLLKELGVDRSKKKAGVV